MVMFIILIVVMASWLYTRIKALIAQLKVCAVHHTSIISQSCKKKIVEMQRVKNIPYPYHLKKLQKDNLLYQVSAFVVKPL